ncbi:hypothetical protein CJJ19_09340 [Candidatus Williamhamiltonella defendens]|nr:autotransporter outer membrane beta-barrel domain-containing protein [Candidatus Hamiltonella defensa]AYB49608.1 hypothetical protein CJJ19_09340 [Candidatus Hamiltonella defensa]
MMRYKKITLHTLRLSVLTMLIHSGGGFSETKVFNGGTHELTEQAYPEGIEARNQAQVNNRPGQPLSLSSDPSDQFAVKVNENSSVTLEGTEKNKIAVETKEGINSYGLWAKGSSTLKAKHMQITLNGETDTAVAVQEGAKVNIDNSTITGTQNKFHGLWASGKETEVTGNQLKINLNGDDSKAVTSYSANITLKDSTLSSIGQKARGIVASEDAKVTGKHLDIRVEGQGARAIDAQGNSTVDIQNSTISSNGQKARGILGLERAKVTGHHLDIKVEGQGAAIGAQGNSTVDIQNSTISSIGQKASGILGLGRAKVTGHHLDIKVEGQGARAISIQRDSTVDIQNSTLSSHGEASFGISTFESAKVTGNHLNINVEGQGARVIDAQADSTVDIQNSTISSKGNNSRGIFAWDSAKVDIKDSTISSHGKNARGILGLERAKVTGHHLDIKTEGEGARAINAEGNSTVDIQNSTLSSHGEASFGISTFESAKVTGHHLDINVEGQGARAISIQRDSTVDIQNSTLSSHGEASFGISTFESARVTGNHLNINVEGQGARAIYPNQNSTIHLHDSHIQTLSTPSAVLYSDAGSTDPTVTITGGSLHAAGDLIVSKGGKTNLVFSKVVISPPGSGHAIHFTGTGGEVDLTLNQTALSGNIVAEGGNKANVTLDSGSTWSFTNNATVTNLKNAGQMVFEPPHDTPSFSTLTTDDYEGNSGKILFHARLEGDDSPANQLIINEASKGTTRVTVRNVGGKGGATKDGIRLIEAPEGTDGTFVQDGPIVAGSYQYSLRKGTTEDSKNQWYLVSSLIHSGGSFSATEIFDGGTSQLNESSYPEGIEARNQAQVNNRPGQPLSLSSPGTGKAAVKASGESTVTLEGAENRKIVVETQETGSSYGLWASGKETEVTGNQLKINLNGDDSKAVTSYSANITLKDSTLSSIGQKARGILGLERAKVTGHHLDIKVEGQGARAIDAQGNSTVDIQNSTISSNGDGS